MKKTTIMLVAGITCTSLIFNYAVAQVASNFSRPVKPGISLILPANQTLALADGNNPIDKNALKEMKANLKAAKAQLKITTGFSKRFKNATAVIWNNEEKAIVANFKEDGQSTRVVYDKKGNWIYTIVTYFNEELLPQNVRKLVHANYFDFNITLVQEINQGGVLVYSVQIEDDRQFKQVLVCNDEITLYKEFTKSK